MNTPKTPVDRWIDLCRSALIEIDRIDRATEYSTIEPQWWLEMQEVQRAIHAMLVKVTDRRSKPGRERSETFVDN